MSVAKRKLPLYTRIKVAAERDLAWVFAQDTQAGLKDADVRAIVTESDYNLVSAIDRVGYQKGEAVRSLSGKLLKLSADALAQKITFGKDGTIFFTGGAEDFVATNGEFLYWLPYGAVATEYTIKCVSTGLALSAPPNADQQVAMGTANVAFDLTVNGSVGNQSVHTYTITHTVSTKATELTVTYQLL